MTVIAVTGATGQFGAAAVRTLLARGVAADSVVAVVRNADKAADLAAQGVTEVFHKVELKPGKPLWYGQADRNGKRSHVFGLPGNPVSSLVCFELFVRPLIDRLAGRPRTGMPSHQAQLKGHFRQRGNRPTFHPAYFEQAEQGASVEPVRWQGSADQRALTTANCLAYFSAGQRDFPPGSAVPVFLFEAGND